MTSEMLILAAITFVAAIVNGALGYGFSSITVPVALLVVANRVLNPALVMVEVVLNAWVLFVNRAALPAIWRRALPIIVGLGPGVALGTALLTRVDQGWLKLGTFVVLLPLILLQAAGFRRPIRAERAIGVLFGVGVGTLYSITTISGPPLAIFLNNQGFAKLDFRAALGVLLNLDFDGRPSRLWRDGIRCDRSGSGVVETAVLVRRGHYDRAGGDRRA